jgi:hypothetical protein
MLFSSILLLISLGSCSSFLKSISAHGFKSKVDATTTPYESEKELKAGIAKFYDQVSNNL